MKSKSSTNSQHGSKDGGHYGKLLWMGALSFLAMFALMYAMVDRFDNVFPNLNQAYMAALMAFPMIIIEIGVMRAMYMDTRKNVAILVVCAAGTIAAWIAIRNQAAIADTMQGPY